jgi:putative transposase
MKVCRQSIYWEPDRTIFKMNRTRYKKSSDQDVLEEIQIEKEDRPTYGYKRITAMVNRKRVSNGLQKYNKKRIERVMSMNGLLQVKNHVERTHEKTGKIITLHSNTRWCSDGFEIICFNGEKVYVAFSLDCHDRFAIDFVARKRPLIAEDIQDLMMNSIIKRFNSVQAPRVIQFLSDRGTVYRAKETIELGRHMNLKSCFTRPRTPQSNGMAESFVGTIKRDYVYTSDCFDADTVLRMLPQWIEDYNFKAPHSGLGMLSPVEYIEKIKLGV